MLNKYIAKSSVLILDDKGGSELDVLSDIGFLSKGNSKFKMRLKF